MCVLLVWSSPAMATADSLRAEANRLALHEHPRWLQLGHYTGRDQHSDITSESFFLAPDGAQNPEAELQATLAALFAPVPKDPNQHAQCQFPARLLWLSRVLITDVSMLPAVSCNAFDGWRGQGDQTIDSVSLIAVEGYMRNPSSLYGHVLLTLNQRNPVSRNLLATSVNFGVDLPSGESPLEFISRGLFGGYNAVFSHARFHQVSVLYGDFQERDIWEYRLDLSPDQVDMVVAHTWELLGREFPYYFSGSNCAYRTAAVLNLVLEGSLDNRFKPWTMPHDTFNNLMRLRTPKGSPLVSAIHYHPSQGSVITSTWNTLTRTQQTAVLDFIASPDLKKIEGLSDEIDGVRVADMLIQYYSSQGANETNPDNASFWLALLAYRLSLPPTAEVTPVATGQRARPIHEANYPTLVQASALYNDKLGAGLEGRFRLSYYDLLARPTARPPFTELAMLDVQVMATESTEFVLRRLNLLNLTTLNVAHTALPGSSGWAARLRLGYEHAHLACTGCGEVYAEAGTGKAWGRMTRLAVYGLITGRLASGASGPLGLTPEVGVLVEPLESWSSHVSLGYRMRLDGALTDGRPMLGFETRLGSSRRWDIRLGLNHHEATEARLGISTYW